MSSLDQLNGQRGVERESNTLAGVTVQLAVPVAVDSDGDGFERRDEALNQIEAKFEEMGLSITSIDVHNVRLTEGGN